VQATAPTMDNHQGCELRPTGGIAIDLLRQLRALKDGVFLAFRNDLEEKAVGPVQMQAAE
jgi:hypothetical protein